VGVKNCVVASDQGLREFSTDAKSSASGLEDSVESEIRQQPKLQRDVIHKGRQQDLVWHCCIKNSGLIGRHFSERRRIHF